MPRGVWALGIVSLFMDLSSEMIHALLPIFLIGTLGASPALLGLIEGVAEATASITKLFSGTLSDWMGKRKPLVLLGYGLAALSKPAFPLATSPLAVLLARFADRIGKGLRGAPRDALIADITPKALRGTAFGLRQAMDTVGAVGGPLGAVLLLALLGDIRAVYWWAVLPALLAVLVLAFGVSEPTPVASQETKAPWLRPGHLRRLSLRFWMVCGMGVLFMLARFSEAFLVLRATQAGFAPALAPLVMVAMNAVYALAAVPAGMLSDRTGRWGILSAGLAVLMLADLVLAFAREPVLMLLGAALWGLHMGLTQGLLSAMIADAVPGPLRGTGFGLFNLLSGVALLGASGIAGLLWQAYGPAATFQAGAAFCVLSLIALLAAQRAGARSASRRVL